jgi:Kef-type K+ transport system membrane component KefB
MLSFINIKIPFEDPVIVFSLVLFIIFFAPIALKKLKIPGIIGLILSGVLIGPHCFNLLALSSSIDLFGKVGLIYIMFLAGLEIDLNDFIKNRNQSLVFGVLTFFVPFTIGCYVAHYFLNFSIPSSILVASLFSTQTLVAFPIVSKMGITKNRAVTATIGGTIITDTLVLLVLAILSNFQKGELNTAFWFRQSISLIVFVFIVI